MAALSGSVPVAAQIVTDGTAGAATSLTGPNYVISSTLGTTNSAGTTLVHSFSQFDLAANQSATFQGGTSLTAIIARITSGSPSSIDGQIRSTASNADLYFVNPAGVIFGENASLSVPKSFYVSTADRLNFADGEFLAMTATPLGTLSTAAPQSFGFLGGGVGQITLTGPNTNDIPTSNFGTYNGDLMFVASDVSVSNRALTGGSTLSQDFNNLVIAAVGQEAGAYDRLTPSGPIGGTVTLSNVWQVPEGLNSYISGSTVNLINESYIGTYAVLDGLRTNLSIISDYLYLNNSYVTQLLDLRIQGNESSLSHVDIVARQTIVMENSHIITGSFGAEAPDLSISTGSMSLDNSFISNYANKYDAGGVNINISNNLILQNGSSIKSEVVGSEFYETGYDPLNPGNAGTLNLNVGGTLTLVSNSQISVASQVLTGTNGGAAGTLNLTAGNLVIDGNGYTAGRRAIDFSAASGGRSAGSATIAVAGDITFTSPNAHFYFIDGGSATGQGGTLRLTAGGDFTMIGPNSTGYNHGIELSGSTDHLGGVGVFNVGGALTLRNTGVYSQSGQLALTADEMTIDGTAIWIDVASLEYDWFGFGGGQILLQAPQIAIGMDPQGGFTTIDALGDGQIVVRADRLSLGTGANFRLFNDDGASSPGLLELYANDFEMTGGAIFARAYSSDGESPTLSPAGNIIIGASRFNMSGGSITTRGGSGGTIHIGVDEQFTLTGGQIVTDIDSSAASTDGYIYLGALGLSEPVIAGTGCDATCAAFSPYSTAWTPGTRTGVPPTPPLNVPADTLGVGEVIVAQSTNTPEQLSLIAPDQVPQAEAISEGDVAETADSGSGEGTGRAYVNGSSTEAPSICRVETAQQRGRSTFSTHLTKILSTAPGGLRPELYTPPETTTAAAQDTILRCGSERLSRVTLPETATAEAGG